MSRLPCSNAVAWHRHGCLSSGATAGCTPPRRCEQLPQLGGWNPKDPAQEEHWAGEVRSSVVILPSVEKDCMPLHKQDLTRHAVCSWWSKMLQKCSGAAPWRSQRATGAGAVRIPRRRPKSRALEEGCQWSRSSSSRNRFPLRQSGIKPLVSVAQHFVISRGLATACPRGCGSVKPSEHFRAALNPQSRKPLSAAVSWSILLREEQ
jgi:hypothetical protein